MGRSFYQLLAAFIISIGGDWTFKIAIPVIVYELTHSATLVSFFFACPLLSHVALLPIGGVVADALPRSRTLYLADLAAAGCCIAICGYRAELSAISAASGIRRRIPSSSPSSGRMKALVRRSTAAAVAKSSHGTAAT